MKKCIGCNTNLHPGFFKPASSEACVICIANGFVVPEIEEERVKVMLPFVEFDVIIAGSYVSTALKISPDSEVIVESHDFGTEEARIENMGSWMSNVANLFASKEEVQSYLNRILDKTYEEVEDKSCAGGACTL